MYGAIHKLNLKRCGLAKHTDKGVSCWNACTSLVKAKMDKFTIQNQLWHKDPSTGGGVQAKVNMLQLTVQ